MINVFMALLTFDTKMKYVTIKPDLSMKDSFHLIKK